MSLEQVTQCYLLWVLPVGDPGGPMGFWEELGPQGPRTAHKGPGGSTRAQAGPQGLPWAHTGPGEPTKTQGPSSQRCGIAGIPCTFTYI